MNISEINELDDTNFREFIEKNKVAIVDFYADWCGPCKALKPVMEELSEEMKGKVAFGEMNIDRNKESVDRYGIMSIPTLVIFNKGKLVDRMVGALPMGSIRQRLSKFTP